MSAPSQSVTDTAAIDAGKTLAIGNVLTGDTDVDKNTTLSVGTVNGETIGTNTVVHGTYGDLTISANGSYSYVATPALDALQVGQNPSDVFNFTVADSNGGSAATTLTFNITGAADTPAVGRNRRQAVADTAGADVNTVVAQGNALTGDTDRDTGATLSVSAVNGQANEVGQNVAGQYGTLHLGSDGSYTYTANAALDGLTPGQQASDQFSFTVASSDGASTTTTLTFNITGAADTPTVSAVAAAVADTAGPDVNTVVAQGNALTGDTDRDAGATLSVSAVNGQANEVGQNVAGQYGTLHLGSDGSYTTAP